MAKRVTPQHRKGLSTRMVARVNVCAALFTAVLLWASAPGHAETKSPKFLGQILSAGSNLFCFNGCKCPRKAANKITARGTDA